MRYLFAPMEGVTGCRFRAAHNECFGGVDRYYSPFLSPDQSHRLTPRDKREILPEHNRDMDLVPQVLTKSAEDFIWCAGELAAMGYGEVNLNLGCPSGTVAAKGKGAGFLAHPQLLDDFLARVFAQVRIKVSVKTRLGISDPEEFGPILEIYNKYPISELILHPRVQKDFYKHPARMETFERVLPGCKAPVCYNGDLYTQADCIAFQARFPQAERVMLGRGLVADPALARRCKGGAGVDKATLRAFHDRLYHDYCSDFGSARNAIQRMQELWTYLLKLFADQSRHAKRLRKAVRPPEYEAAVDELFRDLELLPQACWES